MQITLVVRQQLNSKVTAKLYLSIGMILFGKALRLQGCEGCLTDKAPQIVVTTCPYKLLPSTQSSASQSITITFSRRVSSPVG